MPTANKKESHIFFLYFHIKEKALPIITLKDTVIVKKYTIYNKLLKRKLQDEMGLCKCFVYLQAYYPSVNKHSK